MYVYIHTYNYYNTNMQPKYFKVVQSVWNPKFQSSGLFGIYAFYSLSVPNLKTPKPQLQTQNLLHTSRCLNLSALGASGLD